ncbi:hypothetical protein HZA38_03100 [Candidatus Peregrinibacteria bacterium]|nr:hypothetical protein [Candidatus Peregrinibacteria bacterium]
MNMQISYFQTADWYLFVWLIANRFEVKAIDKQNRNKCLFFFEDSHELTDAVEAFWQNSNVRVQDFILAVKKAKVLLHADSF